MEYIFVDGDVLYVEKIKLMTASNEAKTKKVVAPGIEPGTVSV